MPQLIHDCPRCDVKRITFDIVGAIDLGYSDNRLEQFEAFCKCGSCGCGVVFLLEKNGKTYPFEFSRKELMEINGVANYFVNINGHVTAKDFSISPPPKYLPKDIERAFIEGAKCMNVECFNAAATMFRLCLDFSTKSMLPEENVEGLNQRIRRSLGFRMEWLFETGRLPKALEDLAGCVKDDGNDGAHEGILDRASACDLYDFAETLLERLYTEPEKIRLAKERRAQRHAE